MDQIAPFISWLKKNVFWLACGFMSILMIAIWFLAWSTVGGLTEKNEKDITNSIRTAEGVKKATAEGLPEGTQPSHPNATSEAGVKEEIRLSVDSIIAGWEKRVKEQEKILEWPAIVATPRFVKIFKTYDPPELIPDAWLQGDGELGKLMEAYALKIPERMVYLCGKDVLRTRWMFDPANISAAAAAAAADDEDEGMGSGMGGGFGGGMGGGRGGMGGGMGGPTADEGEVIDMNKYAVVWHETNQTLWNSKLTQFKGLDDNAGATNQPTPLQCCMLQQDLWLLEAMFNIIRDVNGDSNANDLSVIKRLDHVVFGRDVGGKLGSLTPYDPRLGKGIAKASGTGLQDDGEDNYDDDEEGMDDPGSMFGGGGRGGPGGGSSASAAVIGLPPYHNRYVDLNFEPLDAQSVKDIITAAELPDDKLELIVSKRVPVRIALRMKETEIANFMAACANSPFAFEIQQVRWNKHTPGEEIVAASDGDDEGRAGGFDMDVGGFGPGAGGTLSSTKIETRTNYDVNVEFYGVVKIYNPVRASFLRKAAGLEEAADDTANANPVADGNSNP